MVSKDVRNGTPELRPSPATRGDSLRRRGLLAIALSLVIHAIVSLVWPRALAYPKRPEQIAQIVTVTTRTPPPTPRPAPTAKPTPVPSPPPQTPRPHPSFAPLVVVRAPSAAAILPRRHRAGGRAKPKLDPAKPPAIVALAPAAIQTSDAAGVANGGAGTGAGAGAGDSGSGGTGSGTSGAGNGSGGETNAAPCGSVDFYPLHTQTAPDGSQTVEVEMDVTLRAGTTERDTLGWRWHYPSIDANPFNAKNADDSISMQLPPAGFDLSAMKPAVVYAIRHTTPDGILAFEPCP